MQAKLLLQVRSENRFTLLAVFAFLASYACLFGYGNGYDQSANIFNSDAAFYDGLAALRASAALEGDSQLYALNLKTPLENYVTDFFYTSLRDFVIPIGVFLVLLVFLMWLYLARFHFGLSRMASFASACILAAFPPYAIDGVPVGILPNGILARDLAFILGFYLLVMTLSGTARRASLLPSILILSLLFWFYPIYAFVFALGFSVIMFTEKGFSSVLKVAAVTFFLCLPFLVYLSERIGGFSLNSEGFLYRQSHLKIFPLVDISHPNHRREIIFLSLFILVSIFYRNFDLMEKKIFSCFAIAILIFVIIFLFNYFFDLWSLHVLRFSIIYGVFGVFLVFSVMRRVESSDASSVLKGILSSLLVSLLVIQSSIWSVLPAQIRTSELKMVVASMTYLGEICDGRLALGVSRDKDLSNQVRSALGCRFLHTAKDGGVVMIDETLGNKWLGREILIDNAIASGVVNSELCSLKADIFFIDEGLTVDCDNLVFLMKTSKDISVFEKR